MLVGVMATFLYWVSLLSSKDEAKAQAAFNSCVLIRKAARGAYLRESRGVLASQILEHIPHSLISALDE